MTTDIKELVRKIRAAEWHGDDDEIASLPTEAADALEAMAGEVASLQNTFDLKWKADQRAIKLWQEATGKDHIWPDRTKTTLWLLERLEAAESERDKWQGKSNEQEDRADLLTAERDRLKAALDIAKAHAKQNQRARDIVSPYPNDHAKRIVWKRALYHDGKDLWDKLRKALGGDAS